MKSSSWTYIYRTLCLWCLLVISTLSLHSQTSDAELFFPGDPDFDMLRYLSILSGVVTLGAAAPATSAELRVAASAIDPEFLDARSLSYLELIGAGRDGMTVSSGKSVFSWNPSVSIGARLNPVSDSLLNADKVLLFNNNKPFISLPLAFSFGENFAIRSDFTIQQNWWTALDSAVLTNVPLASDDFDMTVPEIACASWTNGTFSFAGGRGPVSAGDTLLGNMLLSDGADRLTFMSFAWYAPNFRISSLPIEIAPDRYVYFHDLAFRPRKNISITLSEAASVNSTLDLRYLNPVMIYHSYAGWRDDYGQGDDEGSRVGTQFGIKIEAVPARGFRVFGQFVMNQFQTKYELDGGGESGSIPNAFGCMAGVEYVRRSGNGFFSVYLEAMYTNPWLYIMDTDSISYTWTRKDLVAPSGYAGQTIQGWLGNPFGPDTSAIALRLRYDEGKNRRYGFLYRLVRHGDNGEDFYNWYYGKASTRTDSDGDGDVDDYDYYYPRYKSYSGDPDGDVTVWQHLVELSARDSINTHIEIEAKVGYILVYGSYDAHSPYVSSTVTYRFR